MHGNKSKARYSNIKKSSCKFSKHVETISDNTFERKIENLSYNVLMSENFMYFNKINTATLRSTVRNKI